MGEDLLNILPSFDIRSANTMDIIPADEVLSKDIVDEKELGETAESDVFDQGEYDIEEIFDLLEITDNSQIECPADIVRASRYMGDLVVGETETSYLKGDCDAVRYSVIMSQGQEFSFYIKGTYLKPSVTITGPGSIRIDKSFINDLRGLPLIFSFKAEKTGEYFLILSQSDLKKATPFSISISCLSLCEKVSTRYPIIMVHGFSGFKNIGPVDYFYKVPDTLKSAGYDVHIAKLDPYNSIEIRGKQLKDFTWQVLEDTGAYKVNYIAHSQGGLDARYVISGLMMADMVGALITVATPHQGTPLADFILADPTGVGKAAFDAILLVMGAALDSQSRANAMASLESLSVRYVTGTFNKLYPDDQRVRYFSYAGKTCRAWENCGDTVDTEISLTYEYLRSEIGDNDGIVPTKGAEWGVFFGVLPADHFDEVGQVAGITNDNFDHIKFYKSLAELLRLKGL